MMKKGVSWLGLMSLVLLVSISFTTGCAKKAAMKDGSFVPSKAQAGVPSQTDSATIGTVAAPSTGVVPPSSDDDTAARARALREKELREKAAREAAEKAAREAAEKAAAILKELQIGDVRFDFDKYNLKPEAQEALKKAAPAYLKYTKYNLIVEGHCDERGTVEYNLALGEKRANEAAKFLTDLGVAKDRIKTISYGKEMPLDKGNNEDAWAKNRRAHFLVSPAK
jgi:peptidoglycan-associated lipoprotein